MPFHPIQPEKRSDAVVRQIELLILRGLLRPGERLPAERDLAERMAVSRPSLREALAELQGRGLLETRAGSGVYVADILGATLTPPLVALMRRHEEAVFDYLSFRRDLEGQAAERAATEGLEADLALLDLLMNRMRAAHQSGDPGDEARLDAEFHLALLEASHNIVLLHMMRAMFTLLREGVFSNRDMLFVRAATRDQLLDQHAEINAAVQARDGARARRAIEDHLDFVRDAYAAQIQEDQRAEIAGQKLDRARERK
ncbi:FCD domain-containing protein [Pseudooceanicola sp. CBS1P-1]|uniref:Pyruvate dehydrogenase complex repressor n=1 Tax=Pseudooceanicola albus TaxID=2692189 RepID=A0A6L7G4L0_9RHOB|nr:MULTISPECIES: FCD domain-containing protein [Pseudooceanicola]MBT9384747.1 FCD domain-containing protein [Pseudooceanicola endophyticus]MXN18448.1 FCD domain-containing protein [Pseudooceanicola albus]